MYIHPTLGCIITLLSLILDLLADCIEILWASLREFEKDSTANISYAMCAAP